MRTLVISDLHLGAPASVLSDEWALERLTQALHDVQRLVLLGDVLELRHGPLRAALAAAEPVLAAFGQVLGQAGEVVVVPGNHDHGLLGPWLARRSVVGAPVALGLEATVDFRDDEPLAGLARSLAPADLRVAYPGVWLRGDVYAMHGHYGDLHTTVPMFERLAAGAMARLVGSRAAIPAAAEDYEAVLAPMYAWVQNLAEYGIQTSINGADSPSTRAWRMLSRGRRQSRDLRREALKGVVAAGVGALNRAGLGPLHSGLSGAELRRAALRAFEQAVTNLGVTAHFVVFGHTHRAGPLPGDEPSEWSTAAGVGLLNTGCWVREPHFLGAAPRPSPYRAGFALLVDEGSPELVNVLD